MGVTDRLGKPASSTNGRDSPREPIAEAHLIEPRDLLRAHRRRLDDLHLEGGYSAEQFERLVESTVLRVAEYVHLLPATRGENHAEPGGLLRFAIEGAALAFRRCDGQFLAGPLCTDVRNRERERAWRFSALLAGLLRPLGRCSTRVQVVSPNGEIWDASQEGLWPWLRRLGSTAVDLRWRDNTDARREEPAALWIASRLVPPAALDYLSVGGEAVLETLVQVLGGVSCGRVGEIVSEAQQAAVDLDLVRVGRARGADAFGIPLEHRLLDALRALIREKWTCNTAGSRLWATRRGVFLQWRPGFTDLAVKLRADGVNGAPRDADTMAEFLLTRHVLRPNTSASGPHRHYHRIVPLLRGMPKQTMEVVQLEDATLLGLNTDGIELIDVDVAETKPEAALSAIASSASKSLPLPFELLPTSPSARQPPQPAAMRAAKGRASAGLPPRSVSASTAPTVSPAGSSLGAPAEPGSGTSRDSSDLPSLAPDARQPGAPAVTAGESELSGLSSNRSLEAANRVSLGEGDERLERLGQFGAGVGAVLRALGEKLASGQGVPGVVALEEGIALAYPQTVALFCPDPQQFLAACESQGLLIGDKTAGGRLVHDRGSGRPHMPRQYVVLSTRVARYLAVAQPERVP